MSAEEVAAAIRLIREAGRSDLLALPAEGAGTARGRPLRSASSGVSAAVWACSPPGTPKRKAANCGGAVEGAPPGPQGNPKKVGKQQRGVGKVETTNGKALHKGEAQRGQQEQQGDRPGGGRDRALRKGARAHARGGGPTRSSTGRIIDLVPEVESSDSGEDRDGGGGRGRAGWGADGCSSTSKDPGRGRGGR